MQAKPVDSSSGRTRHVAAAEGSARHRSRLESVGSYVPERRVTTDELLAGCKNPDIPLQYVTGIAERRFSAPGEDSFTLALAAAKDCLAHSSWKADELELLVFCGISRFEGGTDTVRYAPSISARLKRELGATKALVFDLSNACAGMLSGLFVVDDFIRRGVVRSAMVVSGECISNLAVNALKSVDELGHPEAASLTLGDAGAALIAERSADPAGGIQAIAFETLAEHVDLCTGGTYPHGPGGQMFTRAKEIHKAATQTFGSVALRALARSALGLAEVDHVIIHQTSVRAIQHGKEVALGIGGDAETDWMINVDTHGNTASTSHFVALRRFLGEGRFEKGARILLGAQASGLVLGAAVLTMDHLGDRYRNAN